MRGVHVASSGSARVGRCTTEREARLSYQDVAMIHRETNRSTVDTMLRERWSDDGVVGQMPEIGKVLVGAHNRCRKRERSRKSCCHHVIAVVIRLRKCPPATQTQSFLREQPSSSNATPETSWLERDGTAPWFLSLKTKPNIKRYQLRCCVLLP